MQVRAEVTRRLVIDAAVELFDTIGYGNASLADLIAATGVSKGAFYYHFTNKNAVAAAIIAEADAKLRATTLEILADQSSRSLAGLIRAVFVIAGLEKTDSLLRVGVQLRGGLGQISAELEGFNAHLDLFTGVARTALAEGDLLAHLDADQVGFTVWAAVLGTHQHCGGTGEDTQRRLADAFTIILPGICPPDAAAGYVELVKSLRSKSASARR